MSLDMVPGHAVWGAALVATGAGSSERTGGDTANTGAAPTLVRQASGMHSGVQRGATTRAGVAAGATLGTAFAVSQIMASRRMLGRSVLGDGAGAAPITGLTQVTPPVWSPAGTRIDEDVAHDLCSCLRIT